MIGIAHDDDLRAIANVLREDGDAARHVETIFVAIAVDVERRLADRANVAERTPRKLRPGHRFEKREDVVVAVGIRYVVQRTPAQQRLARNARRDLIATARLHHRLRFRQQRVELARAEGRVEKAGVIAAGEEHVTLRAIARLVVIVDGNLVRAGRVAGQRDVAIAAAPQLANGAIDVGHAVANPFERRTAERVAGAPNDAGAAVVEREERDVLRDERRRQQIRSARLERRTAAAMKPDDDALRCAARLVQQSGQRDAVGRLEPYEAAGWL